MIRVTLELVSGNDPANDRLLGIAHIANTGPTETIAGYSYDVWLSKTIPGRTHEPWKRGRAALVDDLESLGLGGFPDGSIQGFDRDARGAWDLIYLLLKAVVGRRNGG